MYNNLSMVNKSNDRLSIIDLPMNERFQYIIFQYRQAWKSKYDITWNGHISILNPVQRPLTQ